DPEGLRVVRKARGETTHYVFEGTEPIYEKNVTTGKVKNYIFAGMKPIARVDGVLGDSSSKKYWITTDHIGNYRAVTNEQGRVVWQSEYTPFGSQYEKSSDPDFEEWNGFAGKELDPDSGLMYFNARWYDADTGRFISEDPARDPNSPGIYCYCRNNPINVIDPTGLYSLDDIGITSTTGGNFGNYDTSTNIGGGESGSPYTPPTPSTGTPENANPSNTSGSYNTNIPGVNYNYSIVYNGNDYTITDSYTNADGKTITVTTEKVGNTTTQTYKISYTVDGITYEQTGTITYAEGTEGANQRNVLAVENFVSDDNNKYEAIQIVLSQESGVIGGWQGSTLPNNTSSYATIVEGKYRLTRHNHSSSYADGGSYPAFTLNGGKPIATTGPNPNTESDYSGQYLANGINLHSGFKDTDNNGSQGCQTIKPGEGDYPKGSNWNSFYDAVNNGKTSNGAFVGYYYLIRL
ncbi:MAG: RHS domain-containing protein, partial [Firmicutes bacterium]|nr:RHS domain-containing protein [Bacillota bacterium]